MKYAKIISEQYNKLTDKEYNELFDKGLIYDAFIENTKQVKEKDKIINNKWKLIYVSTRALMTLFIDCIFIFEVGLTTYKLWLFIVFQLLATMFLIFGYTGTREIKTDYKRIYKQINR